MRRVRKNRAALAVYFVCFAQGAVAHILDLAHRGLPLFYYHGPLFIGVFWTALVVLDPAVLLLLFKRRRVGLVAALGVMLLDVSVNGYAVFVLHDSGFTLALPLQCLFLGFVLGSFSFLWPVRHLQ